MHGSMSIYGKVGENGFFYLSRGGFSLVWFSLGFDVGLVQNHKR